MNRAQLEHIIRAATQIADCEELIIIGSQAILGQFPDAPASLLISMEADVYPKESPELADVIDGSIGELSPFHDAFGYYAQGVGPETAILPQGWEGRLVPIRNSNTRGATGWCLEVHDLVLSKAAAGREKDLDFVQTALAAKLADVNVLLQRADQLPIDEAQMALVRGRITRAAARQG